MSPNFDQNTRLLITGASGFVGSSIRSCLENDYDVTVSNHNECNLEKYDETYGLIKRLKPSILINAAGKAAGIQGNLQNPSELLVRNSLIALNVSRAAHELDVKHMIQFASACVYPLNNESASKPSDIGIGPIEESSKSYAMSKLLSIEIFSAYRKQFGREWITVIPSNLYGAGDWGHGADGHVVAMLLERFLKSKSNLDTQIEVWGDGKSCRNFLNVTDLAQCVKFIIENNVWNEEIINVNGEPEISICELAELIAKVIGFGGKIAFDEFKPNGARRKILDDSFIRGHGWSPGIDFENGLLDYCTKYQSHFE